MIFTFFSSDGRKTMAQDAMKGMYAMMDETMTVQQKMRLGAAYLFRRLRWVFLAFMVIAGMFVGGIVILFTSNDTVVFASIVAGFLLLFVVLLVLATQRIHRFEQEIEKTSNSAAASINDMRDMIDKHKQAVHDITDIQA